MGGYIKRNSIKKPGICHLFTSLVDSRCQKAREPGSSHGNRCFPGTIFVPFFPCRSLDVPFGEIRGRTQTVAFCGCPSRPRDSPPSARAAPADGVEGLGGDADNTNRGRRSLIEQWAFSWKTSRYGVLGRKGDRASDTEDEVKLKFAGRSGRPAVIYGGPLKYKPSQ